jgi:type II secretory pathway component GspD/PulD (secretin)
MTRAVRFSQADVTRAVKATERAGLRVAGVKIQPDGSIFVVTGEADMIEDFRNPLDRMLGNG